MQDRRRALRYTHTNILYNVGQTRTRVEGWRRGDQRKEIGINEENELVMVRKGSEGEMSLREVEGRIRKKWVYNSI